MRKAGYISMSRIEVNMQDGIHEGDGLQEDLRSGKGRWKGIVLKALAVFICLFFLLAAAASAAGFLYWRSLSGTPQYALAMIVDAAREGNEKGIEERVDVDAVVEDFVPQITDQAIELYGRGLPPDVLKKAEIVAAPVMPVIKQRAKAELPLLLRKKTRKFERVPFWVLVVGADRYLEIETNDDTAVIRGRHEDRELELRMMKKDGYWKVVGVKDEALARKIAEKIGQELILLAKQAGKDGIEDVGRKLGLDGIGDLMKQAEDIFR